MFKLFAIIFIGLGIYIGVNYTDEINSFVETDTFEQVQEKLVDGKDKLVEKLEEIKD
ncbi:hypothetical protein HWV00_08970 [Moritella sp. 24]|uniref:hypothetical protein n=1 Tax=Moritella sp. 24 TaxID=2746230 RepID=UPI001BACBA99|nr:hypothetical protein [Moritella sp. 24]QUM76338.1 hypothetical protein HWV00_08970 [Moritella sp. 24]